MAHSGSFPAGRLADCNCIVAFERAQMCLPAVVANTVAERALETTLTVHTWAVVVAAAVSAAVVANMEQRSKAVDYTLSEAAAVVA